MARRFLTVVGVAALALAPLPSLSSPARAVQAPVSFTATPLPTYQTNGVVWALAQAQGLVFVGGKFTALRPPGAAAGSQETPRTNLAVLDAATGQPTSCAPAVEVTTDTRQSIVRALEVSPDGRTLYVGGYFTEADGATVRHLVAYDIATCARITAFAPQVGGSVRALAATATRVYLGGSFSGVAGAGRLHAGAVQAVGTPSPGTLLPWAPAFDQEVYALALKPDESVVAVGGLFDTVNGMDSNALAVVDAGAGLTVHSYPGWFIESRSRVKDIAVDATGFYTANEGYGTNAFDGRIALDWGTYAQRWRDLCSGATQGVAVHASVVYSASHAHNCTAMGSFQEAGRHRFLAQSVDDPTLVGWFPNTNDGIGEGIGPRVLTVAHTAGEDFLWSGGEFTMVNGVPQQGLTRFGQHNRGGAPTQPTHHVNSPRAGQVRVAWRQSIDMDDPELTYRVYRDNGTTPVHTARGTSWFWSRRQMTFTDTGLAPGSTHTYRVTADDGQGSASSTWRAVTVAGPSSAYADRVLADGPTFLWRYDEPAGALASDATDNGNNGTIVGNIAYQVNPGAVAGDPSRALSFLGGTSTIHGETLSPSPTTYTLETWFRTTTTTGGKLISFGDEQATPSERNDKSVYLTDSGKLAFGVQTASTTRVVLFSRPGLNDGAWHHVAATQGPNGMALYVDGTRVARNTVTANYPYTGYWRVGGDFMYTSWPECPTSTYFAGTLDETAVYPTALSGTAIRAHVTLGGTAGPSADPADFYGATVAADDPQFYWRLGESQGTTAHDALSADGPTGVYEAGVGLGAPGAVAGTTDTAVRTSGDSAGTLASSASVQTPRQFSAEAWFRVAPGTTGKIIGMGTLPTGSSGYYDRHVYLRADGRLAFGVRTPGGPVVVESGGSYADGEWHHVVASQGGDGMELWADGVRVASNAETANVSYAAYWRIGGDTLHGWPGDPENDYVAGTVDEVAVYLSPLSPAQVAAHHGAGRSGAVDTAPPTAPGNVTAGIVAGDVRLTWEASMDDTGVTGYEVHRSAAPDVTPGFLTLVGSTAQVSHTDLAVRPGTWYYRVVALDAAGNRGVSPVMSLVVSDVQAPTAPADLTAMPSTTSVALSWSASTDDVGVGEYLVYRSATSGFTPGAATMVGTSATTEWVDAPVARGTWYYRVVARDAAGNLGAPSAQVTAVVRDEVPPTVPSGLTASLAGSEATLAWTASTDDTAVAGYEVHRSSVSGFVPGAGTRLDTTAGTTFTDNPPEGLSFYRVVALDAAGNRSEASGEVGVTRTRSSSVRTLSPTADAFTNRAGPNSNYGAHATLVSRGTSEAFSYLRFVVPEAPAGTELGSAVLQVRTTTDADAASGDQHSIRWAPDTWVESQLTWNTRPTPLGAAIGTVPAGTVTGTDYQVPLDGEALRAVLGRQVSMSISSTGTDIVRFASSNNATVAARPRLVLTFVPVDAQAPTVPADLEARAHDGLVDLSWSASSDDVAVSGYDVYRSSTRDFTADDTTRVTTVTGTSLTDTPPGLGTWYYRVAAGDAAGNRSDACAAVGVFLADAEAPPAPTGVAVERVGADARITWDAAPDGLGVTAHRVHMSASPGFTADGANLLGTATGTSFTQAGVGAGTWYYRVLAQDAAGNLSEASSAVELVMPDTAPPSAPTEVTATVEATGVVLSWGAASDDVRVHGYEVHRWDEEAFTPGAGTLVGTVTGTGFTEAGVPRGRWFYRVLALDEAGNRGDASAAVPVEVPDLSAPSAPGGLSATAQGSTVSLSWTAATDDVGVAAYDVHRSSTAGFTPVAGTLVRAVTGTGATDSPVARGTWYYRVVARDTAGNTGPASAEARVEVPDTTAPSVPGGVVTTVVSTTVGVSWQPAGDDVGVTGYRVYRAATPGTAPADGVLVASVTGRGVQDGAAGQGTWYYRVVAVDAAGNASDASTAAVATVHAGATSRSVEPVADTYANEGGPSLNFGTQASLLARGSRGGVSYLRFAVPSAPEGTTLRAAVLRIRTNTDPLSGSVDPFTVRLAGDAWNETELTWNNRPAAAGAVLGTLPAHTVVSSPVEAPLSVADVASLAGQQVTFAVTGAGTDSLWFWSREFVTVSARPQLLLTYAP